MKIAHYGTEIVVMHAMVHGLYGLAHEEIPVPLSLLLIVQTTKSILGISTI